MSPNVTSLRNPYYTDQAMHEAQSGTGYGDPSVKEQLGVAAACSYDQVQEAVSAAQKAAQALSRPGERARYLYHFADAMHRNAALLSEAEARNAGKPIVAARADIMFAIDVVRFFAGAARTTTGPSAGEYKSGFWSAHEWRPVGIVASILPWNYPLLMAAWKIGAAVAGGCPVILKPATLTPYSALLLADLCGHTLPPGALSILPGPGEVLGAWLAAAPGIDMITFTGSTKSGREVGRIAVGSGKRVHLEMGGNAPVIVTENADLDAAAEATARAVCVNAGQDCTAAGRVFVQDAVARHFTNLLLEHMARINEGMGPTLSEATVLGPLISEVQAARVRFLTTGDFDRLTFSAPPNVPDGYYYGPEIIVDPPPTSAVVTREIFGPVAVVMKYRTEDEVIERANASQYGLSASVWSTDLQQAHRLVSQVDAGMVWVNTHLPHAAEMPHAGRRGSGPGIDLSVSAVYEYMEPRHIMFATGGKRDQS